LGADVIKIERPGTGDVMRDLATRPEWNGLPPAFVGLNAGKRSLAVNLRTPEGRELVRGLAATADVFVENFRPGKAAKVGLDAESIRAVNPRIICCSISGWGQGGPNAERAAYDHVIQAATGMMALQGSDPAAPPVKVGFPVIDIATGLLASVAILSAVLRRQRGDLAPIVLDVSMVDAAAQLMTGQVAAYWLAGAAAERVGNRGFVGGPGADTFPTADGWISTAANTLGQFRELCRVLGRPELLENRDYFPVLPQEATTFLRGGSDPAVREALVSAFGTGAAVAWEERLSAVGVPASAVRTLAEYLEGPYRQTPGADTRLTANPCVAGRPAQVLGAGFRGTLALPPLEAPTLGQHTAAILGEAGVGAAKIEALRAQGIVQ
jgi:crotonobetainyl-CoA:carnitine CoA-transferase CaiB-like acyl-CoA transferase